MRLTGFMVLGLVSVMSANLMKQFTSALLALSNLRPYFAFPIVMLLQSLTMGLAVGASSVVARRVGAASMDQAKIIISHSLVITVLMVGVLIVLVRPAGHI